MGDLLVSGETVDSAATVATSAVASVVNVAAAEFGEGDDGVVAVVSVDQQVAMDLDGSPVQSGTDDDSASLSGGQDDDPPSLGEFVLRRPHEKNDIVIPSRFDNMLPLVGARPPKRDFNKIYSAESQEHKPHALMEAESTAFAVQTVEELDGIPEGDIDAQTSYTISASVSTRSADADGYLDHPMTNPFTDGLPTANPVMAAIRGLKTKSKARPSALQGEPLTTPYPASSEHHQYSNANDNSTMTSSLVETSSSPIIDFLHANETEIYTPAMMQTPPGYNGTLPESSTVRYIDPRRESQDARSSGINTVSTTQPFSQERTHSGLTTLRRLSLVTLRKRTEPGLGRSSSEYIPFEPSAEGQSSSPRGWAPKSRRRSELHSVDPAELAEETAGARIPLVSRHRTLSSLMRRDKSVDMRPNGRTRSMIFRPHGDDSDDDEGAARPDERVRRKPFAWMRARQNSALADPGDIGPRSTDGPCSTLEAAASSRRWSILAREKTKHEPPRPRSSRSMAFEVDSTSTDCYDPEVTSREHQTKVKTLRSKWVDFRTKSAAAKEYRLHVRPDTV